MVPVVELAAFAAFVLVALHSFEAFEAEALVVPAAFVVEEVDWAEAFVVEVPDFLEAFGTEVVVLGAGQIVNFLEAMVVASNLVVESTHLIVEHYFLAASK